MNYAMTGGGAGELTYLAIKEENHYYPFGLKHENYNVDYLEFQEMNEAVVLYPPLSTSTKLMHNYKYNGKELQDELGLNMYDYGARNYDPAIGRWFNIDNLSEDYYDYSPYNYVYNDPVKHIDPDGNGPEDIIIYGKNNSSLTIKTNLIHISVNAGSLIGDIGGNYTLKGDEILSAALDIVGIVDPTGIADALNASLSASNGNWGDAMIAGVGIIPYAGDLAKAGKIKKDINIIENAIDAVKGTDKAKKAKKLSEIPKPGKGKGSVPPNQRDKKRVVSKKEKEELHTERGGQCEGCDKEITVKQARAHHTVRHADGGETTKKNTNLLCDTCHKEIHQ
jgi:RHS repeat-associated protein